MDAPTPEAIRQNNMKVLALTFNTLQAVINRMPPSEYATKVTLAAAGKTIYELYEREQQILSAHPLRIDAAKLSAAADVRLPADFLPASVKDSHYYKLWTGQAVPNAK